MRKYILITLVVLDLFWAVAAALYDWPLLRTLPIWLWPVVAICPLYPLLLAGIWMYRRKSVGFEQESIENPKNINSCSDPTLLSRPVPAWLLAWGALGGATYGASALFFYPTLMVIEGFSWLGIGAIAWVLFYGLQGWYLVWTCVLERRWIILVGTGLLLKTVLDIHYLTFGYLVSAADGLSDKAIILLGGVVAVTIIATSTIALARAERS